MTCTDVVLSRAAVVMVHASAPNRVEQVSRQAADRCIDLLVRILPKTCPRRTRRSRRMLFLLWILAVILVIWGIITCIRGAILPGIILIILGLLVGPGGASIFT